MSRTAASSTATKTAATTSTATRIGAGIAVAVLALTGLGIGTAAAQTPPTNAGQVSVGALEPVGKETLTFTNNSHLALVLHYSVMGEGNPQERTVQPGESWAIQDWVGNARSMYHFNARTAGDYRDAFAGQVMYNRGQGFVGFVLQPAAVTHWKFTPAGADGAKFSVTD